MVSLVTNVKAITEVQNVEIKQINDTSDNTSSKIKTSDNNANLYKTSDETSSKNQNNINDSFNRVLNKVQSSNSKADMMSNFKNEIKKVQSNSKDSKSSKLDKIEEELEEKVENLTDEQLMQCLNLLADFINNNLNADMNLNANMNFNTQDTGLSKIEDLTEALSSSLMEILNADSSNLTGNTSADLKQNTSDVLSNLLNALNKVDDGDKIDTSTLKLAQQIMSEVDKRLTDDLAGKTDVNTALKELVASTENKLNELFNSSNKEGNELTLENSSLNNIYKNITTENSSNSSNDDSKNQNSQSSETKDDKILKSILNDKSTANNVPVFTTNTIVNNAAGTVMEVKQVVNAGTMTADIVQNVKYMSANDMREMVVKVNPGNLGEITIKLVEENGIMKLHMKAASKETYALLAQQSGDIKNQLNDQNIKIHDVNISLYEEDTTFFKEGEFANSFNEQKGNKGNQKSNSAQSNLENDEETEDKNNDSSAVNMLA